MPYNLIELIVREMVDSAAALAQVDKAEMEFDLSLLTRRGNTVTQGATVTDANLMAITAEATAVAASVATMVPGELREKYERRLRRLTERKAQLTDRLTDFDAVMRIDNEFDRRRLGAALAETNIYLAELAAHRLTLTS